MQRAYLSSDASLCASSLAETLPPPLRNRRQIACAAFAFGESGTDSIVFPVPLVLGSGKSGTPWLRMQLANLIASAIGSPEAGGVVGGVGVGSGGAAAPGARPPPRPAGGGAAAAGAAEAA